MIKFKKLSRKISWVTLVLFLAMTMLTGMPAQQAYAAPASPVLISAIVTSTGDVELTFDKEMANPSGNENNFTVRRFDGTTRAVSIAQLKSGDAKTIELILSSKIFGGEVFDVMYTAGTVVAVDGGVLETASDYISITNDLPHPTLNTSNPPAGTVGTPYSYTFTAGEESYTFYQDTGTLPPGLSLNTFGVLGGTPSANGTYSFKVIVMDNSTMAIDKHDYTMDVNAASGPITSFACSAIGNDTASFTWPLADGATAIKIQYSLNNGTTWQDATHAAIGLTATAASVTGLTQSTAYIFKLVVTGGGNAGDSNQVTVCTPPLAQLYGHVSDGIGVPGASISVYASNGGNFIGATTSSFSGSYSIAGVPVGTGRYVTVTKEYYIPYSRVIYIEEAPPGDNMWDLFPVKILTAGYPKMGTVQADGSKKVELLVKANGDLTSAYYVVLPDDDGATQPSAQQIKDGQDSSGAAALQKGSGALTEVTEQSFITEALAADATAYDIYVVLQREGSWSEIAKLDVTTPPVAASSDATITGITVDGQAATVDTNDSTVYNVELPVGTVLATLTPANIVVTANDANANVGTAATTDGGATWTVEVTAQDGTTKETYTINVTVAADTTPPEFADGYPQAYGDPHHPGSKHVTMSVKPKNETVTAYYVAVAHDADAPDSEQVIAGTDSTDSLAIDKGSQGSVQTNGYIINSHRLPADNTVYDFYVVITDATGNASLPAILELTTPIKLLTDEYPQVGAPQAAGSKQVEILNMANGSATAYYMAVANDAAAPLPGQIMDGIDGGYPAPIAAGNIELVANTQASAIIGLPADAAQYDVYVVLYKNYSGGGFIESILSEIVKLDVTTPPAKSIVTRDPGNTGGAGAVFNAETNTFSGTIDYYPAAVGFPPTAGNYVGVKITAPTGITVDATNATFKYNQAGVETTLTGTWLDGGDFVYYYPKVTEVPQSFIVKIDWDGSDGYAEETITINVAADAVLITPISIAAIHGVTAPVKGATPVTTITETGQFTGTVTWDPAIAAGGKFAASTIYTATINLTPKPGYILSGVAADFFTVAGADSVTNDADSGIITAVFPKTSAASTSGGGGALPGYAIRTAGSTLEEYGAEFDIPKDAVKYDTRGDIERFNSDKIDAPDNSFIPGNIFELTKVATGDFLKPITVTLPYKASAVDMDKYDLSIYWFDEDSDEWVELDNVEIDEEDLTVSGKTEETGYFALIATKKAVVPPVIPPVEPQPEVPVLTDISDHWAEANIEYLVEKGAIAGYLDNTFRPDNSITRAEFAVVIVKAFDLKAASGKVFEDTANHWAKDYIATSAANGIVTGYSDKEFGPDELITREQMAVIIVKAAKLTAATGELTFSDKADVSAWASSWVVTATQSNLMSGYPDNTFKPQGNATRAEAVTVICNVLKK